MRTKFEIPRYELRVDYIDSEPTNRVSLYSVYNNQKELLHAVEHSTLSDAIDYMIINHPIAKLAKIVHIDTQCKTHVWSK